MPLEPEGRTRYARSMSDITYASIDPRDPLALSILTSYLREEAELRDGVTPAPERLREALGSAEIAGLQGAGGDLIIARRGDSVLGCGGVRWIDVDAAEPTLIYALPAFRDAGIEAGIAAELERRTRLTGRRFTQSGDPR